MITIHNLHKTFRNETTLSYRDMTFEDGKSYVLLGASGCGKSTLLNMIAGILSPESGEITVDGEEITALSQKEKDRFRIQRIGYIYQDFKLIDDMTVMDNINVLRLEGVDTSGAPELLRKLGIEDKKNAKIRHLSGGQKQRVAIARALVKNPDIILADEPTGNLNYKIGEEVVKELLAAVHAGGDKKVLIAVTHDERLAKYFDVTVDMNEMTADAEGGDR